ncbi:proprotein convertase subtilisin/kexin type 5-like, partial [Saccoglossus kowalevskii]|uniref:Proprotein convertase subtilisin/kexin type 5-like n=1 Tax=Saccoglossus kowalevskii TaxID=10224 RepID=A0ABM0LWY6_SACKO
RLLKWNLLLYGTANEVNPELRPGTSRTHSKHSMPTKNPQPRDENGSDVDDYSSYDNEYSFNDNCHPECLDNECDGPDATDCWNCAHYKDRNTLECVKRCPRGYYAPDLHHRCRYCDSTCNTCNGPSSADCLTCADGMFLVEDRGVCKSECGEGYFEDSERKMCVACHPRCTRCLYSADYCLSCKTGMKLQGSECIVSCPAQMYQTEENTCRSCHESCDSCTGSFETDCLSCAIGYLHQDGLCINSNVCEDGYYKAWEAECLSCHSTCETCNGPSEEDCLSCKQRKTSFHLQDGRCIANCPRGEFLDGDDCTPCHMTCATCHGTREDQCYECEYGLFLKNNSTCVGECGEKNYGLNGECRSCHSSCLRCRGGQPTDCTQCKDSKYLLEGICVDHCSTGYYGDEETGNCLPCDESCFTCIGPRYNECIECPDSEASIEGKCQHLPDCHGDCKSCDQDDPNLCNSCYNSFFLYENRCVSITECPSNTYANEDTNECHACHQQCHSCFDKHHTSCLSCSGDYFLTLDSTCESVCPPQTYFDYDNNICGECHPSCAECIGSDVDDCTSCDDKRWLSGYMCVYECEDNQYLDESSLCMPCHRSCETCDGPSDFDCKTCHQNYDIRDGNCLSRCSFGEYESHDTCELCHPTCGSCTGGSSTDCLSCEFGKFLKEDGSCERLCGAGYYEDYSSGTCQKCHVTCKTCLGNTDTDCLECNDGDILYEGVSCVKHCPIGFYAQNMMVPESISECQPCALECEDCTQHRDNCVSCQHSTFLYNGTCVDACPMYYTEDGNECVRTEAGCPSFCKQCNQIGDCEECDNGFRIHNGLCYLNDETCLNGQYDVWIDNKLNCHDCHDGCATCVGPSQYDCTSCNGKKILEGGKCVAHCLNSEYHDTRSGRCEACHSSCWECEGPAASQCTECNFHFFFDEDTKTCRSNCPTGMFEIGVQCMPCHESCSTCDGDTEIDCLSCELPLYHKDYSCLTECPDGYYGDRVEDVDGKDVQECRRCHYNCKTCQGPMDDDCTSCQEHLVWNRHSCRTDCGPGFFVSDGKCERCDMSCEKCSGSTKSECLSCADGKVLERGECKDKCESNYYYENNECIQCHPSCEKCTGPGPQDCSKCSLNAQLVENVCYPRCQAGYYYNDGGGTKHNVPDDDHIGGLNAAYNVLSNQTIPQCRKCHETCKECIGGGAKNCLECNIPKQLNKVTHQCVECCDPNSVTVPDNNCCVCDNGTCILSPARRQYTPIVETKNVAGMIGGVIVCIVTVFFIVFGVLQCRSKRALCFARNYHRLPTHYESKTDEVSISRKEYLDEDVEIYTKNDL